MGTAGASRASAYGEPTSKLCLAGGGQRGAFLVSDSDPLDVASADRIGERVERVADQSEDMLDANPLQHIDQNICDCLRHLQLHCLSRLARKYRHFFRSFDVSRP